MVVTKDHQKHPDYYEHLGLHAYPKSYVGARTLHNQPQRIQLDWLLVVCHERKGMKLYRLY